MEVKSPTTTDVMLWHCTQSLGYISCGNNGGYTRIYTPRTRSKKWLPHSSAVAHYCALQPLYEGTAKILRNKPQRTATLQYYHGGDFRLIPSDILNIQRWWTLSQNGPRLMVSTNSWSSGNLHGCQRQTFPALNIFGVAGTKLPNGHPAPMQPFTPCRSAWQWSQAHRWRRTWPTLERWLREWMIPTQRLLIASKQTTYAPKQAESRVREASGELHTRPSC